MRRRRAVLLVAIVLLLPRCAAAGAGATDVVAQFHEALLGVLKDSATVGYAERFARLKPVMDATFDLPFMAEKSVGRAWRTLGADDRARWVSTFEGFTVANYAGRFTGYAGQTFETLGTEQGANETTLVRTRLVQPTDDDVELTYRLRRIQDRWRIIDVYLNGTVSELALRRTEYSSVLKRDGFDQLVAMLDQKTKDLAAAAAES